MLLAAHELRLQSDRLGFFREAHRVSALCVFLALASLSCKRETRTFEVQPPSANTIQKVRLTDLQPGDDATVSFERQGQQLLASAVRVTRK